jgi:hypothetical protein
MAKKAAGGNAGESVQGYFRRILQEDPRLLRGRSNAELLRRWQQDHHSPGEIPHAVKVGLQNAKSALRSKGRKRKARQSARSEASGEAPRKPAAAKARAKQPLEKLEEQIDDCLTTAKVLDREGLEAVIHHLRRARNEVVWKMGQ